MPAAVPFPTHLSHSLFHFTKRLRLRQGRSFRVPSYLISRSCHGWPHGELIGAGAGGGQALVGLCRPLQASEGVCKFASRRGPYGLGTRCDAGTSARPRCHYREIAAKPLVRTSIRRRGETTTIVTREPSKGSRAVWSPITKSMICER
jgi:hypothetical protein